jgi:hypothetical protein
LWGAGVLFGVLVAEQVACVAVLGVDNVGYDGPGGPGGSPPFHGAASTQQATGPSLDVTDPAEAQPGDLVWATLFNDDSTAGDNGWFSLPSGWSEVARERVGCGGGGHVQWAWHIADGGPRTSTFQTSPTGHLAALLVAYQGLTVVGGPDANRVMTGGGGGDLVFPSIRTTLPNDLLLLSVVREAVADVRAPAGMEQVGTSSDGFIAVFASPQALAGPTGDRTAPTRSDVCFAADFAALRAAQ